MTNPSELQQLCDELEFNLDSPKTKRPAERGVAEG
jgi:hypothetical protein